MMMRRWTDAFGLAVGGSFRRARRRRWRACGLLAIAAVVWGAGCTAPDSVENPEQAAADLFEQASQAAEAGRLGESAALLARLMEQYPGAAVAPAAEAMRGEVLEAAEAAGVQTMRDLAAAQAAFMGAERRYALEMAELLDRGLLEAPSDATAYRIRMRTSPAADAFSATGEPVDAASGLQTLFVDESGVVRGDTAGPATIDSPVVSETPREE